MQYEYAKFHIDKTTDNVVWYNRRYFIFQDMGKSRPDWRYRGTILSSRIKVFKETDPIIKICSFTEFTDLSQLLSRCHSYHHCMPNRNTEIIRVRKIARSLALWGEFCNGAVRTAVCLLYFIYMTVRFKWSISTVDISMSWRFFSYLSLHSSDYCVASHHVVFLLCFLASAFLPSMSCHYRALIPIILKNVTWKNKIKNVFNQCLRPRANSLMKDRWKTWLI